MSTEPTVSVVLPCLNEEEALPSVISKIEATFREHGIDGEIVVCDNGSTDRSAAVARELGARVVSERRRGYGSAYITGFAHARGRYLVMGDADDTYDFGLIPLFLERLRKDCDFVSGSRYLTGGSGKIPFLHRYVGNPMLTLVLNRLFGCRYTDVYCGFRAFTKEAYEKITPVSLGMEFNLELAINASLAKLRIAEIPIELKPRIGESKLRTFRDGWRSLRMMLLYSPNKVFLVPGVMLFLLGASLLAATNLGWVKYQGRPLGMSTAVLGAIGCILGFKVLSLGLHAKTYSWSRRFDSDNPLLAGFYKHFTLERGILAGLFGVGSGLALLGWLLWTWIRGDLQPLPRPELVPLATTLLIIGAETSFASLFISAMSMDRREIRSGPPTTEPPGK